MGKKREVLKVGIQSDVCNVCSSLCITHIAGASRHGSPKEIFDFSFSQNQVVETSNYCKKAFLIVMISIPLGRGSTLSSGPHGVAGAFN